MGRISVEVFDPEELDIPIDVDFELEGIDEEYETYHEYEAYLPDRIQDIRPLSAQTQVACASAEREVKRAGERITQSPLTSALAELLLCAEAVSTVQIENYRATCTSLLEYRATTMSGLPYRPRKSESVAMDAAAALREFGMPGDGTTTLDDICDANARFANANARGEACGMLRERPVFIGGSLFDAEFVPPPAYTLDEYMIDFDDFVNAPVSSSSFEKYLGIVHALPSDEQQQGSQGVPSGAAIAKAAIAQAQFVTIHPFEDGNGRTCRAISQRLLHQEGVARGFILPVSASVMALRSRYVSALTAMHSTRGPADPNRFVAFYAQCCEDAAHRTVALAQRIEDIWRAWLERLSESDAATKEVMELFAGCPVAVEPMLSVENRAALDGLLSAGIVERQPLKYCDAKAEAYVAPEVLDALEEAQSTRR